MQECDVATVKAPGDSSCGVTNVVVALIAPGSLKGADRGRPHDQRRRGTMIVEMEPLRNLDGATGSAGSVAKLLGTANEGAALARGPCPVAKLCAGANEGAEAAWSATTPSEPLRSSKVATARSFFTRVSCPRLTTRSVLS
jgi:hypothetical protein